MHLMITRKKMRSMLTQSVYVGRGLRPLPYLKNQNIHHMATKLPVIGTDWLDGCVGKYVIVSLKHSTADALWYWKAHSLGYTPYPFTAGIYDQFQIEEQPLKFNDGLNAAAIPLTATALQLIGFPAAVPLTDEIFDQFVNIEVASPEEG